MIRYEELDAEGFAPYADSAVDVYGEAMHRPPEVVAQRRKLMVAHLQEADFHGTTAIDDTAGLVGFGYTYPGRRGQWWHDSVATALGRPRAEEWLTDSLELVELHVRPAWQGEGIGRRLLQSLIERATQRTMVLSTHDRESPARRLYRAFAFEDLLTGYRFPGGTEVFAIMGKRLR